PYLDYQCIRLDGGRAAAVVTLQAVTFVFVETPPGSAQNLTVLYQEGRMEIDRRAFIRSLGGAAAVAAMDHEAKAEALEHYMEEQLDQQVAANQGGQPEKFPTWAEIEPQIEPRPVRGAPAGGFH